MPETAVIFLTARDLENDMLKGFAQGADDYITKPFPISVLKKKNRENSGEGTETIRNRKKRFTETADLI